MRRGIKVGLYGVVLAGLAAGTLGWTGHRRSVELTVDGASRIVHTNAGDVQGVLKAAGISVGQHDLLAPGPDTPIASGAQIVLNRGHLLHLSVDGSEHDVWVNADSVAEALDQLGYGSNSFVSVSRARRLDSNSTAIAINSPKTVTFLVDGKILTATTGGPTVADALADAGLQLGPADRLSVSATSQVSNQERIRIQRVTYSTASKTRAVPFTTQTVDDPKAYAGTTTVAQAGKDGREKIIYQLIYVDGKLSGRIARDQVALTQPSPQVEKVGTKKAPAFVASTSAGSAQRIAAGMVAARNWGSDQFQCLVLLWDKESGWRTNAANASGAYGIPQALPGSKMASAGADWETSAATQITWGLNYITGVYGTPCVAWAHSQADNWY